MKRLRRIIMKKYDLLIIGFGKGGKTLAKFASGQGKSVAVVDVLI